MMRTILFILPTYIIIYIYIVNERRIGLFTLLIIIIIKINNNKRAKTLLLYTVYDEILNLIEKFPEHYTTIYNITIQTL